MDFGIIQKLTNCIVRPPKSTYDAQQLGSPFIQHRNRSYQRDDFTVINNRGLELHCSFIKDKYAPIARQTIIFLHANSSCRLVIKNYIDIFLPYFDLLSFDFAGCGMSEGQYLTLGYNQKEDVYSVIRKIRERYGVKDIILWGRSMGAATAIFYTAKYGGIKAIISDNSFSDLQVLVNQLSDEYVPFLPSFLVDSFINSIQQHIQENIWKKEMTDFNIRKLKPISVISRIKCPIFFIGSIHDSFVKVQHTKQLYRKTLSLKKLELVKGDHNDLRSDTVKQAILKFLIDLNISDKITNKQRIHIFKNIRASSSLKKQIPQIPQIHMQKIDKNPYCYYSSNFENDMDQVICRQNNQDIQKRKKQQKNQDGRQSITKRRRIFQNRQNRYRGSIQK